MKLNLFFRKSEIGFYSIETVFKTIEPFFDKRYDLNNLSLPNSDLSYKAIKSNLKYSSRNRADINHITGHINYIALATGKNTVLTIHDMISALQGHPLKRFFMLCFWFWIPALFVKRITVISEHTKREVFRYIPFAKSKVVVINNPIGNNFEYFPKEFNRLKPNILCVGTKSNKNLDRIFKALASIDCKLTIIGKLENGTKRLLEEYQINYLSLVDLSEEEVIKAYKDCDLLCFASLYEGFGMPIIEAQAIGRPVITSNFGAMKEISKGTTCLVDPLEVNSIQNGIEKIISDESYRQELVSKGIKNAKRFKAEFIAEKYIKVYEDILNG
ncbi:glycosyltransferase family 4 protein [Winogradskyella sp. PG-2]|uniref:glycosyltransferase family 4 protein n=1 Tax=Winogradskyella sp. PG-2 TaxID=754409 RepID=UPI0004586EF5|nr:glycosyltransferase family 1 protein [Winogradskyella sp. PG-2]BAO76201.1 mannosyltransferase [Winogradskyella sp. PG-2]